ncbi:MAG: YwaF family protein [Clostridia bacterium]|nr:YwaF family protein [Clostridia bacterium]
MVKLFEILNIEAPTTPRPFGPLHLVFIFLITAVCVLFVLNVKKVNDKIFRRFMLVSWITIVSFEILKQLIFSTSVSDGRVIWDFQWYAFPFQFCSMLHYLLPFVIFCKESKFRDSIMAFLSSYSLFAGFVVAYIFVDGVFTRSHYICVQTLVNHGLQVIVAVAICAYYRKKLSIKWFLSGVVSFICVSGIAFIMDMIAYNILPENETFNMFFISPYYPSTLAVIGKYKDLWPYGAYLALYFVGFTFVAFVFYEITYLASHLPKRKRKI